jgi:phosphate uptake regulator
LFGLLPSKLSEETRKLQLTGGSTYIVSLPKRWIAQNQLKRGSSVKLREEEEGGLLTIVPPSLTVQKRVDDATIKVSPKDDTETIARKIVSAYLAGYSSIHIKTDQQQLSAKQRHDMKIFVRGMLVGTEIVTDTSTELTLQVLLTYPELTIQSALRRMSIITTSMHKDAILALKTRDNLLAKEVISTDNEVDRFNLYVIRLLKTAIQNPRLTKDIGLVNGKDCLGYRIVTKSVERTADHAVNIAENVLTLKHDLDNHIVEKIEKMSAIAIKMFDTAIESLFRQDYNTAESIMESVKEIVTLEREAVLSSQIDIEDAANLRLIIESARRTAEYACDIAEIVLNLTVDSILV